jgi:hypothetical protein
MDELVDILKFTSRITTGEEEYIDMLKLKDCDYRMYPYFMDECYTKFNKYIVAMDMRRLYPAIYAMIQTYITGYNAGQRNEPMCILAKQIFTEMYNVFMREIA